MLNGIQRNLTADVLKGLAVVFMIQIHVIEQFATAETENGLYGSIAFFLGGPFCAPVFMAVMGYFLAASSKSFSYFLKRGVILFLLGIALNIGRSVHLLFTIFKGQYNLDPLFYIFGADILTLAGLSIMFIGILRLISKNNFLLYGIVMLIFASLDGMINAENLQPRYLFGFFLGDFEHTYFPMFPWFGYALAGYLFYLIRQKWAEFFETFSTIHLVFSVLATAILIVSMSFAYHISVNLDLYYHHHIPTYFAWVLVFILIYSMIINAISHWLQGTYFIRSLAWMGKNVTLIYIIQWLIIGNIATAAYRSQSALQSWWWFMGITLVSCMVVFIINKLRTRQKAEEENLL